MHHTYLGETISFNIAYKRRGSIGIYVDHYGNIEIQAPKATTDEKILQIVEGNWRTIIEKSNEMKQRLEGPIKKAYEFGETFLYLGIEYSINISQDLNSNVDYVEFNEGTLHIVVNQLNDETIKQALRRFYYQQCKVLVERSIKTYQKNFKMKPTSIRITDSKRNWGTCDTNRQLTFNWRLAMAPMEVIDYVVVHEMCHMLHMNHDRSFWRLVGKIIPNYKECEKWLALSNWKMTV